MDNHTARRSVHLGPGAQNDPQLVAFIDRELRDEIDVDAYGHPGELKDLKLAHVALASKHPECSRLADGRDVWVYRIMPVNGKPGRVVVAAKALGA